jgi:hypothetical protein
MTTAVVGATGRIGSEIVRGVLARGDAVTALVRDPGKARRAFGEHGELHIRPTRLDDPRDLTKALDGIRPSHPAGPARGLPGSHPARGHTGLTRSRLAVGVTRSLAQLWHAWETRGEDDLPNSSQYGDSSHPRCGMRAASQPSDLDLHLWAILGSNR